MHNSSDKLAYNWVGVAELWCQTYYPAIIYLSSGHKKTDDNMMQSFTLIFLECVLVGNNQTPAKLNRSTEYFSTLVWWAEYFLTTTASPHPGPKVQ